MPRFKATLVPGRKAPYTSWTFIELPAALAEDWGAGPHPVRGTLAGAKFRGTVSRGEGAMRMPVTRALQAEAGVERGASVQVVIERDAAPRPVKVPAELRAVLEKAPGLAALFAALPPSHRRAWTQWIDEAKKPETRARRAAAAPAGIRKKQFP